MPLHFKDLMIQIQDTLSLLVQAEQIMSSSLLTDDEKTSLITSLKDQLSLDIPGVPAHLVVARGAIERMLNDNDKPTAGTKRKAKARKAKGSQDAPEVDEGRTGETAEAPKGKTERVPDEAEDADGAD